MSAFGGKADIVGEGATHIDVLLEGGVKFAASGARELGGSQGLSSSVPRLLKNT